MALHFTVKLQPCPSLTFPLVHCLPTTVAFLFLLQTTFVPFTAPLHYYPQSSRLWPSCLFTWASPQKSLLRPSGTTLKQPSNNLPSLLPLISRNWLTTPSPNSQHSCLFFTQHCNISEIIFFYLFKQNADPIRAGVLSVFTTHGSRNLFVVAQALWKTDWHCFLKWDIHICYDLTAHFPKRNSCTCTTETSLSIFSEAQFTSNKTKTGEQLKCPQTEDHINKFWLTVTEGNIHTRWINFSDKWKQG